MASKLLFNVTKIYIIRFNKAGIVQKMNMKVLLASNITKSHNLHCQVQYGRQCYCDNSAPPEDKLTSQRFHNSSSRHFYILIDKDIISTLFSDDQLEITMQIQI